MKYGLIISMEKYQRVRYGLTPVKYANNDGKGIKEVFTNVLGIPEANILYYENDSFTKSTVENEIAYFLSQFPENAELYVYYAGHGFCADNENYLTVFDSSSLNIIQTSISFEKSFMNRIKKSNAKTCVVFIDACAEAINQNVRGINFRGFDFHQLDDDIESTFRYAVFFSCSPHEKSLSDDSLQHGVWTWFLLQALHGDEGAFDSDGSITIKSLELFLRRSLKSFRNSDPELTASQTPYTVISSNSSWPIIYSNEKESFEDLCLQMSSEFLFQCNLANQDNCIGAFEEIFNFAQARDVCWYLSEHLCYDWETIVAALEYYTSQIERGKQINLSYSEKRELLEEFQTLINSIPTYYNGNMGKN